MNNGTVGNYILALLFLSALVIGITTFYSGVPSNYNVNATNWTNTTFASKASQVSNMSANMKKSIEDVKVTGIAEIDLPLAVVKGGIESIFLAFSSMDLFITMVTDMANATGIIPSWFTNLIIAALGVILVLLVIGAIYKYELVKF